MLENQASVNMQNNYGATPLHILAQHPMPELIKLMIENGADRNATDKDHETPLTLAIKARNTDNVERLITEENINMPNNHRDAALHIACKNGFSEIVELLIMHNADIFQKNEDGNTPIHIATIYKQKECVEILVENGADFLELNDKFKSAFALSTGEITAFMKREIERTHKQKQALKLRHADHVSIAKSKNQKASSRMSFRSNQSQQLNSQTQSKVSSRVSSRVPSRAPSRLSSKQQENIDSQISVISKSARSKASTTRSKTKRESQLTIDEEEYLDVYVNSIYSVIDNAQKSIDEQIDEVQKELDILRSDLKAHNMLKDNDGDVNIEEEEQVEN